MCVCARASVCVCVFVFACIHKSAYEKLLEWVWVNKDDCGFEGISDCAWPQINVNVDIYLQEAETDKRQTD